MNEGKTIQNTVSYLLEAAFIPQSHYQGSGSGRLLLPLHLSAGAVRVLWEMENLIAETRVKFVFRIEVI